MPRLKSLIIMGGFLLAAACGGGGGNATGPGTGGGTGGGGDGGGTGGSTSNSIAVNDNNFNPKATTVTAGTTVTWTWGGANLHDVTFSDGTASATQSSGTYQRTFTTAGTYNYHCSVHGNAMSGTITVQ